MNEMQNITAETTTFPADARTEFENSFGATFTDGLTTVTLYVGAIDPRWVPICHYAILGVVGEAGLVSFEATPV